MKKSAVQTDWVGLSLAEKRYEVTARLGQGGMGYVYRARDRRLKTDVVIKVPRRALLQEDPEFTERFGREVSSLVRLAHPHIVRVIDVGTHDDLPFVVLQYLPGGSLEDRRAPAADGRPAPVTPEELAGYLPEVAAALDFMHGQGYLHRDVKPANILFDAHGHVYLSDFGIAKALKAPRESVAAPSLTGTGMVLGTPQYMAPELIMGQACDGRVDQYALAVMTYELLAGRPPFDGPSAAAIFVQHTTAAPPPLRDVRADLPRAACDAVHKGLAKEPERRFPNCRAFARAVLGQAAATGARSVAARKAGGAGIAAARAGTISCPGCGHAFCMTAEVRQAKRLRCPQCRTTFLGPALQTEADDEPRAAAPKAETRPMAHAKVPTRPNRPPRPTGVAAEHELERWDGPAAPAEPPRKAGSGVVPVSLVAVLLMVVVAGLAVWAVWGKLPFVRDGRGTNLSASGESDARAPFLSVAPIEPVVLQVGKSARLRVKVNHRGGDGKLDLKVTKLPPGVKVTDSTLSADGMAELLLTAAEDAEGGERTVQVEARLASLVARREASLTVRGRPALFLKLQEKVVLEPGGSSSLEVRVDRRNCQGEVRIEVEGFTYPLLELVGAADRKTPLTITLPADKDVTQVTLRAQFEAPPMEVYLKVAAHLNRYADRGRVAVEVKDVLAEYAPDDGARFRVKLPGAPLKDKQTHQSPFDGRITHEWIYTLVAKKPYPAVYQISYVEGDIHKGPEVQVLEKELHKLKTRPTLRALFNEKAKKYDKSIRLGNRYAGRELLYGGSKKVPRWTRLRAYAAEKRVYFVILVGSKEVVRSKLADRFFKSFEIIPLGERVE
jgi:hypothetical protein